MNGYSEAFLVIGAKGHAKEVLEVLYKQNFHHNLAFYDDTSNDLSELFFDEYPIYRSIEEAKQRFEKAENFVLGVGNPLLRHQLTQKFRAIGGQLMSVIADNATIGHYEVALASGLNVMSGVLISNSVFVGEGTLLNAGCALHHDVRVGNYCEVAPGARLLGGCSIGNLCSIGANATVLPKVKIGNHVVVGAGAVITKDVKDNCVVVGVPGKWSRNLEALNV